MSFWAELRRRNVVKVAVAYAIVGWLMIEIASVMGPALNLPDWATSMVAFFLILGFPVSLVLAWAYELTPDGMRRTETVPLSESITHVTGQKLNYVVTGLLVVAVGFLVAQNFLGGSGNEDAAVAPGTNIAAIDGDASAEEEREALANSVAVLPFENLSPDPDNEFFAAGIHEEVLSHLAKIRDLNVIARTSVLGYPGSGKSIPEIADELNVELVMEGSVRIAGDAVRVTAQLIDGTTNLHVWTQTYPGDLSDIFAIQADIAQRIAMALEAELTEDERDSIQQAPTSSQEAYAFYLRAMAIWDYDETAIGSRTLRDNIETYLNQAIVADPNFALAYAHRAYLLAFSLNADAGTVEGFESRRVELEGRALADLATAMALDPDLGAAHWILARIHQYNWRGPQAQAAYTRALELSPSDPRILADYALFTAMRGRHEDSLRFGRRSVALDPNSGVYRSNLATIFSFAGDFAAAAAASRRAVDLAPAYPNVHFELAQYEGTLGNDTEALNHVRIAERILEENTNVVLSGLLAYIYSRLDRTDDAARLFRRLEDESTSRRIPSTGWIFAYLGTGDEQRALEWMNRAAEDPPLYEGHFGLANIAANGLHDPVLEQPEFVEARSRLGFRR